MPENSRVLKAINVTKEAIRKRVLAEQAKLSKAERKRRSSQISAKLFLRPEFKKAKTVMFYVSKDDEVDTSGMIKATLKTGKDVLVPVTLRRERRLIPSRLIDYDRELAPGPYGILQPRAGFIRRVSSDQIDLVIVPGVAFDKSGNRLGRGAGYYDRFLAGVPKKIPRIGLAFDFQVLPALPKSCHDLPVDKVLSA